jgi:AcrR family transcriptional regulator
MSPRTAKQYEEIRKDKQELLKATALRLFSANGYQATPISVIAKEASISKGLMYNYFESKEDLLTALFDDYFILLGSLLNPNNDHEITNEEMEFFIDSLAISLKDNQEYWTLFFQLSMQPDVLALILAKLNHIEKQNEAMRLLYTYFAERYENPEQEFLLFNSIIKGFSLLYVLSPQNFSAEATAALLARVKKMFIREKLNSGLPLEICHS